MLAYITALELIARGFKAIKGIREDAPEVKDAVDDAIRMVKDRLRDDDDEAAIERKVDESIKTAVERRWRRIGPPSKNKRKRI